MTKELINKVVWWIPFKNLRDLIRNVLLSLLEIKNKTTNIDNKIIEIDNKINNNKKINLLDNKIIEIDNKIIEIDNKINNNKKINLLDNKIYEYDFIFSIGGNCFPAEILRGLKLRKYSSPLDWTYGTSIYSNLEIINNKFYRFIELEDLIFSYKTEYSFCYKNKYNGLYFSHDFFNEINKEQYMHIKEKYNRRIHRLVNDLHNLKILMVYVGSRNIKSHLINIDKIIYMINSIRKTYNNDNIDLLYIQHYPYKTKNIITFTNIKNMIHLYSYDITPKGNTPFWMGNIENTTKILQKYKLTN